MALDTDSRTLRPDLRLRSGIRLARDQTISSSTDFLAELAERTGGALFTSSL